ncbi:MAG: energy-coupling factor ABC transporter permease [Gammaproteobacteria bacterium]|nr:energy-coupling factor ABC transporter permease [Gammaproteobacteria bacterium]
MEVTAALLPSAWLIAGHLLLAVLLFAAARTAPWARLRETEMQHAWFGGIVALAVLWWIRAGIVPGLGFHFFGVTALTLMFGWQFACLSAVPVLLAGLFTGHGDLPALGVNALVLVALPVAVTWTVHALASRLLPWNFFIYLFVNCYFAAVLSMALATATMSWVQFAAGAVSSAYLWSDYLPFLPMMLLSEGFINGAVITVLVATRPSWVWTFDDARYLRR